MADDTKTDTARHRVAVITHTPGLCLCGSPSASGDSMHEHCRRTALHVAKNPTCVRLEPDAPVQEKHCPATAEGGVVLDDKGLVAVSYGPGKCACGAALFPGQVPSSSCMRAAAARARVDAQDPARVVYVPPRPERESASDFIRPGFVECPTCAAKPGMPALCRECLERRALYGLARLGGRLP